MKIVLLILGSLAALVILFVIWRLYATIAGSSRTYRRFADRIAPVIQALEGGRIPRSVDLERFAADRTTRKVLYEALETHERLELFPPAFRNQEAMAEADLVMWLAHPNELGATPDELQLMKQVAAPGMPGHAYYVFRYLMREPHWSAKDGWTAGVAGPYDLRAEVQASGQATFSRFEAYDSRTPEEHVLVTHLLVMERKASPPPVSSKQDTVVRN